MCNHRKADRLLEELGWSLPVAPAVPRGAHWRLIGAQYDGDPQWETYLGATSAGLTSAGRAREITRRAAAGWCARERLSGPAG